MPGPTFYIVAGEASGYLHGSSLMHAIHTLEPEVRFQGHGGDKMVMEGLHLDQHIQHLAMMGFSEVFRRIPFMMKIMHSTLDNIRAGNFDRVILIDYPGFNLRLAKKISRLGIPVTYFILPQVWAWKENRVNILAEHTDQRLSIFPFEAAWFRDHQVDVSFIGHPFVDIELPEKSESSTPRLILLPGSRQQEVNRHWPVFLETAKRLQRENSDLFVHVVRAPGVTLDPLPGGFHVSSGNALTELRQATAALVASGTASLEAAIADCPAVVCYRLSSFSWMLARSLVRVRFASIVNLIAEELILPEFLQGSMKPDNLVPALRPLLSDTPEREHVLTGYEKVRERLGEPGVYDRAADEILNKLKTAS